MKFGIVGVIAFIIDWGILNILVGAFHMHNVLAATISFIISLIFNYVASMKMVFKHREDMARWMEIVIFVVGAVLPGLILIVAGLISQSMLDILSIALRMLLVFVLAPVMVASVYLSYRDVFETPDPVEPAPALPDE